MKMRVCKKCGLEKDIEEFEKSAKCADGRTKRCKKCAAIAQKKKHQYGGTGKRVGQSAVFSQRADLIRRHGIDVVEVLDQLGECE